MLDEGNNVNLETPEDAPPPEESNNRTFLIVGGIFAALIFLTLICGAVYVLWLGPKLNAQKSAAAQATSTGNALVVMQMTTTAQAALWTPTSAATFTPVNTNTPVPANTKAAVSPTPVIAGTLAPATALPTTDPGTLVAMQTELSNQMTATAVAAGAIGTPGAAGTPGTPAALGTTTPGRAMPKTGFFDEVGLPGLIVLTLALLAVIFLARRMRSVQPR